MGDNSKKVKSGADHSPQHFAREECNESFRPPPPSYFPHPTEHMLSDRIKSLFERVPLRKSQEETQVHDNLSPPSGDWHFSYTLTPNDVPTWSGNPDTLPQWIIRINSIARRSSTVRRQLGVVVPTRLRGAAEQWYYSLPDKDREYYEQSWDDLRDVIGRYYMNETWAMGLVKRAHDIRYREPGHETETPRQYFIRKRALAELAFNHTEVNMIGEIMAGAPKKWAMYLQPRSMSRMHELEYAIVIQEEDLLELDD